MVNGLTLCAFESAFRIVSCWIKRSFGYDIKSVLLYSTSTCHAFLLTKLGCTSWKSNSKGLYFELLPILVVVCVFFIWNFFVAISFSSSELGEFRLIGCYINASFFLFWSFIEICFCKICVWLIRKCQRKLRWWRENLELYSKSNMYNRKLFIQCYYW